MLHVDASSLLLQWFDGVDDVYPCRRHLHSNTLRKRTVMRSGEAGISSGGNPAASSCARPAGPAATIILMCPRYGPSQSSILNGAAFILHSVYGHVGGYGCMSMCFAVCLTYSWIAQA